MATISKIHRAKCKFKAEQLLKGRGKTKCPGKVSIPCRICGVLIVKIMETDETVVSQLYK